ncbi:hypothetical protein [Bifidobacterium sp. SO1]|uniref:hypothetical protein n=1 Tax=Bifidobacterium sp. SO1 TaxID=2809029 RepID=UPI001BDC83B0|nr:hypothetical protein [Bifidobacterium sp. SO1]MBT1163005.1 hypothetical protein [Bifidobacterium sp. SO1]
MSKTTVSLAEFAARYVRDRRSERQSVQLTNRNRVELTVIQNQWANLVGKEKLDIYSAPEAVIRSIETTKAGHELFDRLRDENGIVLYGLRSSSLR